MKNHRGIDARMISRGESKYRVVRTDKEIVPGKREGRELAISPPPNGATVNPPFAMLTTTAVAATVLLSQ